MDDMEDDGAAAAARYHPKQPYSHNHSHHSSATNRRSKIHIRNAQYPRPIPNRYPVEHDDDDDDDDDIDDDLDDDDDPDDDVIMEDRYHQHQHQPPHPHPQPQPHRSFDPENEFQWHPKKRKLKNLDNFAGGGGGNYEFVPRVKMTRGGGGSEEWSEHAVFVLLEVWGDRFLQNGRRSLRSEDWQEVASKVSESSNAERSEGQCMNMLDRLKRKYKKEKAKIEEMGGGSSKWGYYKKMEMLMASNSRQECGLACGVDSGEYVFMNTRVYLEKSNGFDEMRDSPGESETDESDDDDENGSNVGDQNGFSGLEGGSYRVLADSIHKFGEIYESIESSKRQQMMELEKMKREFNKEMELQKKQILERAQAEIAKIQEADDNEEEEEEDNEDDDGDEDSDGSGEDLSE